MCHLTIRLLPVSFIPSKPVNPPILIIVTFLVFRVQLFGAGFSISDFVPISGLSLPTDKSFVVDLDAAVLDGITVPTYKQVPGGAFTFSFRIDSSDGRPLYYKIFYRNDSYRSDNPTVNGSADDFYGTWGETDFGFKLIPTGMDDISDRFRIVGNPRNEQRYFGVPMEDYPIESIEVSVKKAAIRNDSDWYATVIRKAEKNGVPADQQLELDAIYALCTDRDKGTVNHRWKRNPRMGKYSLLLVVCDSTALVRLPASIKDITKAGKGGYIEPFHYFLNGEGKHLPGVRQLLASGFISLKASIDLSKGIFINKAEQRESNRREFMHEKCNDSSSTFRTAQVEQFFSVTNRLSDFATIPLTRDVLSDGYSFDDYLEGEKRFSRSDLVPAKDSAAACPCRDVRYHVADSTLQISNPGQAVSGSVSKENAGVRSRIGFSYGKYTARIGFPRQLNSTNVWSGVVNAFWLMFQDKQDWNLRRSSRSGYTEKGYFAPDAPRTSSTYYSEIDLELVKTSRYWPRTEYFGANGPSEDGRQNRDIIVSASNWDMADQDPLQYSKGFCQVSYQGKTFKPFRWQFYYQALSDRSPVNHDDLYSKDYYYYQIEWKPKEIIWRIGPSRDSLRVVAYMNDRITNIPDNQMTMVVSQEFHPSKWWAPIPFKQEYIPFPQNSITGKIYELTIE